MKFIFTCFFLFCFSASLLCAWENDPNCGIKRPVGPQGRIINGEDALPHEFPWQASLQLKNGKRICGASILNSRWAITAVHCLFKAGSDIPIDHSLFKLVGGKMCFTAAILQPELLDYSIICWFACIRKKSVFYLTRLFYRCSRFFG